MAPDLLLSPFFLVSAAATLAFVFYSYVISGMQMRKAYRQSLLTLARAVETKDASSQGHGERVASYVVSVAKAMRARPQEILKMEYAAFLQDIGNVQVPHAILNKSGELTPEEFEQVKGHAMRGAEMVSEITFLRSIAPIIRHHHEFWDGSGYPDGLKGDEIPLGSRILAVCTAYDSMVHAKAYRAKMDDGNAVRELQAYVGVRYDGAVVEKLVKVLKKRARDG